MKRKLDCFRFNRPANCPSSENTAYNLKGYNLKLNVQIQPAKTTAYCLHLPSLNYTLLSTSNKLKLHLNASIQQAKTTPLMYTSSKQKLQLNAYIQNVCTFTPAPDHLFGLLLVAVQLYCRHEILFHDILHLSTALISEEHKCVPYKLHSVNVSVCLRQQLST